jgi:hypothetical protein
MMAIMIMHALKIEIAERVTDQLAHVVVERGRTKLQIDLF